jgi:hypothetical protein
LVISGVLGFRIGYVAFPTWHVAVQSAQVVAGLITYPPDNPFFTYHTSLWTLLHQAAGLMLRAGASEIQISLLLSGILGMLAFQALAMFAYALSRHTLIAIGTAFLVFYSRSAEFGVVYPIWLMGTEHTYGSLGLSLFVLVIGLLASNCRRLGGVLLGLAPAIHASLGIWLWLTIGGVIAAGPPAVRTALRGALPFAAAGAGITALSLAVQLALIYEVPDVDPAATRPYLTAFITFWDGHRRPVEVGSPGVILNAIALAIAIVWPLGRRGELPATAAAALSAVVVAAGLSSAFVVLSWIPPSRLPLPLLMLMPARLLNVNAMVFAALLLGVLVTRRSDPLSAAAALATAAGLLTARSSLLWTQGGGRFDTLTVLYVAGAAAIALGLLRPTGLGLAKRGAGRFAAAAARVGVIAVAAYAASRVWDLRTRPALYDWTNEPLFALASAETRGLVAADSSFHLAQLFTRRPVLLNAGALDTLSYAPESAPAMDRLLRDVYGLDLLNPPATVAPGQGRIPDDFNRRVWEGYSRSRWQEIRRRHNVTQVLTHAGYDLDLPIAAQSRSVRLYVIPEE